MMKLNTRVIIIITIVTIITWIGYEAYSTLTRDVTSKVAVREDLLRELKANENEEIIEELGTRISN